jgi:hypothetical protein
MSARVAYGQNGSCLRSFTDTVSVLLTEHPSPNALKSKLGQSFQQIRIRGVKHGQHQSTGTGHFSPVEPRKGPLAFAIGATPLTNG